MEQDRLEDEWNTQAEGQIVVLPAPAGEIDISRLVDEARDYMRGSKAKSTRDLYLRDWKAFCAWCQTHRLDPLPAAPQTVCLYLTDLARTLRPATINVRLAAISNAHKSVGYPTPTTLEPVKAVWSGIRRAKGVAPRQKTPAVTNTIKSMLAGLPDNLLGKRDRALLLMGFAGGLRRSELAALDHEDIRDTEDGLIITIRRSKTDQVGAGREIGLPWAGSPDTCPVRAYRRWREGSGITSGPIFRYVNRHGQVAPTRLAAKAVALVVKRAIDRVGKDASVYSAHSLRAGFATAAAQGGASERSIQDTTGHRSLPVLRGYIRQGSLFKENAAAKLGL